MLAAASLQGALDEVATAWAAKGHAKSVLSFAGTPALAKQIEQGAPADVFVSADEEWADTLDKQKMLRPGSRVDLLTNRLVLIAPRNTNARGLAEIGDGKLALADPASVPAGRYAEAALRNTGQWAGVAGQVVPAENVRGALALVERGEAEQGVVYATDARASSAIKVLATFPAASHPPIVYPAALVARSAHPDAAAFLKFLQGREAGKIFLRHGFGLASGEAR